jgi:hypothetical protein
LGVGRKADAVPKTAEIKTGCDLAESSKEGYGSKMAVLPMTTMIFVHVIDEDFCHTAIYKRHYSEPYQTRGFDLLT